MVKYKNLTLLGSSHIAKESITKVKDSIQKIRPEIIALELDRPRLNALLSKNKKKTLSYKSLGLKGFLLNLIGAYIEKSLSKHTGISPGTEMKTAIKIAKKHNIRIALIDQPINITIKKLLTNLTRREKWRIVKDFFLSFFVRSKFQFDLNKVPSEKLIEKLMKETKKNYPNVYNVLVTERDSFMSKALYKLITTFPEKQILAIVGAGHIKGVLGELKSMTK
ncbi:MAG: TraB domain-containing protein [Nanoarchaeota archaeon]